MSSPNLEFPDSDSDSDSDSPLEAYEEEQSVVKNGFMETAIQGMFEVKEEVLLLTKDNKTFLLDTTRIVDENIGITIGSLKEYCHAKGYQNADPATAPLVEKKTRAPTRKRANTPAPRRVQTPKSARVRCTVIFNIAGDELTPAALYKSLFPGVELFIKGQRTDTQKYIRYLLSGIENAFTVEQLDISEILSTHINRDADGSEVKAFDSRMVWRKIQHIQQALLKHVEKTTISLVDVRAIYKEAKHVLDKWKQKREENAERRKRQKIQQ